MKIELQSFYNLDGFYIKVDGRIEAAMSTEQAYILQRYLPDTTIRYEDGRLEIYVPN